MADEYVTSGHASDAPAQTTTIIRERETSSGMGILIAVILLIAVVAGIYMFSRTSDSEVVRNDAITGAANEIGEAAGKVGDAAQDAAKSVDPEPE